MAGAAGAAGAADIAAYFYFLRIVATSNAHACENGMIRLRRQAQQHLGPLPWQPAVD